MRAASDRVKEAVRRIGADRYDTLRAETPDKLFSLYRAVAEAGPCVVKVAASSAPAIERLRAEARHMSEAGRRAPGLVAPVLFSFDDLQVLVLGDAGDTTIGTLLKDEAICPSREAELARIAGDWLGRFQRTGQSAPRPLWPLRMLDPLVEPADFSQPGGGAMKALAARLREDAPRHRGAELARTLVHSDFHPHNLVLDAQGHATGIDIVRRARRPAVSDITRYLVYARWLAPARASPMRHGVPAHVIEAFLQGYGRPLNDAEVFVHGCEVLAIWAFQTSRGYMTASRRVRLAGLEAMAGAML